MYRYVVIMLHYIFLLSHLFPYLDTFLNWFIHICHVYPLTVIVWFSDQIFCILTKIIWIFEILFQKFSFVFQGFKGLIWGFEKNLRTKPCKKFFLRNKQKNPKKYQSSRLISSQNHRTKHFPSHKSHNFRKKFRFFAKVHILSQLFSTWKTSDTQSSKN